MNGFLVVSCFASDDIPCGLFLSEKDAEDYALRLTEDYVRKIAKDVLHRTISDENEFLGKGVVAFRHGLPVAD